MDETDPKESWIVTNCNESSQFIMAYGNESSQFIMAYGSSTRAHARAVLFITIRNDSLSIRFIHISALSTVIYSIRFIRPDFALMYIAT